MPNILLEQTRDEWQDFYVGSFPGLSARGCYPAHDGDIELLSKKWSLQIGAQLQQEQDDLPPHLGSKVDVRFVANEDKQLTDEYWNQQGDDIGGAYVTITGDHFDEGVTVIVTNEEGSARIHWIEGGQP